MRNQESSSSLDRIKPHFHGNIFVDINLRTPWWNKEIILKTLNHAAWLKCNEEEFKTITSVLNLNSAGEEQWACTLINNYHLDSVVITRGERGASLYTRTGNIISRGTRSKIEVLDTVGAGDALSAVLILGILKKWAREVMLQRAVEFAASICQMKGATPDSLKFYTPFLKNWNLNL